MVILVAVYNCRFLKCILFLRTWNLTLLETISKIYALKIQKSDQPGDLIVNYLESEQNRTWAMLQRYWKSKVSIYQTCFKCVQTVVTQKMERKISCCTLYVIFKCLHLSKVLWGEMDSFAPERESNVYWVHNI